MNFTIKKIYLLLASAMLFSACSEDETPVVTGGSQGGGDPILFHTSLPEVVSRASLTTADSIPYFYVTAFDPADSRLISGGKMKEYFGDKIIETAGESDKHYSDSCVWPEPGFESHLLTFFAYYPAKNNGARLVNASTPGNFDYKLTGFRVATDIAEQVDFVTAYTTGSMEKNLFSGITLPFVHQLARIEIKAWSKHKSCDIEIAGVRIGGTGVESTFDFRPADNAGEWTGTPLRDSVEYIYRKGDKIVAFGNTHPVDSINAVSIMGKKLDKDNDNCAMLIPSTYAQWDYVRDSLNTANQMYISVLLRVTDATLTAGIDPVEKQRYPYRDLSQGADALKIPIVYMAVDKVSGVVSARLYEKDGNYFTDPEFSDAYIVPDTEEIKEFGWAALPVTGSWSPGHIYTYTLNYTHGVGLHEPTVTTASPAAGDPIISDRVGISYSVKEWKVGGGGQFTVPGS